MLPCSYGAALLTWGSCAHLVPAAAHSHKPVDTGLWAALAYGPNWQWGKAWVMTLTLPWGEAAMDEGMHSLDSRQGRAAAWDGLLSGTSVSAVTGAVAALDRQAGQQLLMPGARAYPVAQSGHERVKLQSVQRIWASFIKSLIPGAI